MTLSWRKHRNLTFLLPLCAAALFYQITYSVVAIRTIKNASTIPDAPFWSNTGTVFALSKGAEKAGLHTGDRILSVDGKPLTNQGDIFKDVNRHKPGDSLVVSEVPKGQTAARTLRVPIDAVTENGIGGAGLVFQIVLASVMLLCVLMGVYVALRRPQDTRALLAFGLMISLAQVLNLADWFRFPEPLWAFARGWRVACILNWSVVIAAFGLAFPERFAWDKKRPWLKWLYFGPLIGFNLIDLTSALADLFSFKMYAALPINDDAAVSILIALSISLFFACLGAKQAMAKNPDVRRRLRLLHAGAAIGLGPVGLLLLYEALFRSNSETGISQAFLIAVCVLFVAFPLTLAYVVLTERAMDLRVAVRQGVRYTLARNGLRVLIVIFGILFFSILSSVLFRRGVSDTTKTVGMTLGVLTYVFVIRRIRSQLFVVIDKKFFREHYDAEVLLSTLNDDVRTIVDERDLLQTVSQQISEALHISHFCILMNGDKAFRPVYSLGLAVPEAAELPEDSETLALVSNSREPAPIYFDRPDNWVHAAPAEELVTLKSLGAQLLLPLKAKQRLLGLFCLGPKLSEEPFSKTDINLLRSIALQTGLAVENSRLTATIAQEIAQRERLNREIEIAREVQERLFPQQLPVVAGIDYCGACRPALGVGGDYYDFLHLPNGDLGIAIGDVSGKGIAAALLMASLQASLRSQALTSTVDLANLMSNVNQLVYDATPPNRYATFFYGQYHRETSTFRYVNAGHNPPFILRRTSDGTVHVIRLEAGGPVVGLFLGVPYQQGSLPLEPGDVFVGFTDGISEAMNRADEEWGEEQLIPAAAAQVDKPASEMIPRLMADADRFVDGAPQHDDMTLVVVKMQLAAA